MYPKDQDKSKDDLDDSLQLGSLKTDLYRELNVVKTLANRMKWLELMFVGEIFNNFQPLI